MTPEPDAHQGSSGSPSFSVIDGQTGGQAYEDRLMAIHAMRADGLTLQAIGDVFGITHERVRQLLEMSHGPSAEQVRQFRRKQHRAKVELAQQRLLDWLHENPGSTLQAARMSLAWTEAQLATAVTRDAHRVAVQSRDGGAHRQNSDGERVCVAKGYSLNTHAEQCASSSEDECLDQQASQVTIR